VAEWTPKRFWTETSYREVEGRYEILLDSRIVRTPAKVPLFAPTRALAEKIVIEWDAQSGKVDPATMPYTRTTNSAIDKVQKQRGEIIPLLMEYAGTDLLCYRAERPDALIARQAAAWDPLLDWAAEKFGARLAVTSGIMPVPQDVTAITLLNKPVSDLTVFELTAFYDLVSLSGSLVIALGVWSNYATPQALWMTARLDEIWQMETWGHDEEAAEAAAIKQAAFIHAAEYLKLAAVPKG
jgi:chaperone required for assembly of F1-ATPase